jgi:hypothetical protein
VQSYRSCIPDPVRRILQAGSYRPDLTGRILRAAYMGRIRCAARADRTRPPDGTGAASTARHPPRRFREVRRDSENPTDRRFGLHSLDVHQVQQVYPAASRQDPTRRPPGAHPASSIPAVSLLPCSSSTTGLRGRFSFSLVRLRSIVRLQSIVRRRPQRIAPVDVYGARRLPSADRAPLPRLPFPRTAGGPAGPPRREPRRPAGAGSRRTKPVHALFDHRLLPA